jgi:hypothetical protein
MMQHAGHRLEALKALGEQYFPSGFAADPMAVAFFAVTNGREEFLLRRCRRSINEPLRFEPVAGRLGEPVLALEIQERAIRKELKQRFRWATGEALNDEKIDLFIALFRDASCQLDARSAVPAEPSSTDDNVSYATLEGPVKDSLLKQCARHFSPDEVAALSRFVDTHIDGSDVMTLVLRRQVPIEERVAIE